MSWCDLSVVRKKQIEHNIDITFAEVFLPYYEQNLLKFKGKTLVELGCGTGHLAEHLLKSVDFASYVAIEPSLGMYLIAVEVLQKNKSVKLIHGEITDLDENCLVDVVFSHLVFHVVDDIERLLDDISKRLKQSGQLIFSLPHPCFFNDYKKIFNESEYSYLNIIKKETIFKITHDQNAEIKVPYIHRPLSFYINLLSNKGFRISEFNEVVPDEQVQKLYNSSWHAPRYCVFKAIKI